MILGSHNSWSYLKPKKWWMKAIAFTAKCQQKSIGQQYNDYGVRCFDLRLRFTNKRHLVVAHGLIEYSITPEQLLDQLSMLNSLGNVCVRVLHEMRKGMSCSLDEILSFQNFCDYIVGIYPNIKFFGGDSSGDGTQHYHFENTYSCEGKHASVTPPKLLDDWLPKVYAKLHNRDSYHEGTSKDILFLDFVDIC
jgi:hypothetical protein